MKRTGAAPDGETAEAFAAYQRGLMLRNLVDFDDLVRLPVQMLEAHAEITARLRERFRSVSVDEFQDIDEHQYRLIRLLVPERGNLCVIGDPDQSIYGFRGADASCFTRFKQDYPEAAVIELKRNYRSSGTIVAASAQMIGDTARERSITEIVREMRERITVHAAPTERAEAEFVIQAIETLIGGHNFFSIDSGRADGRDTDLSFADFAVLYRTDAQSAALIEAFARSGIPFKKHSHAPLAEEPAVRAILHELFDQASDEPLAARLRPAAERLPASDQFDRAAIEIALKRLTALAENCARDGARFADAIAVASEADFFDPRADRVALLTLHAAKGLEFPVVFIVGLEDGLLPIRFGDTDETAIAEERRLLYVGMTRAIDRLYLSRAQKRLWRGGMRTFDPSPFLTDIEEALVERHRPQREGTRKNGRQLELF
jgi:DNA helicase-2/ATP-dependent DNA helicase PcrA